jgi:hypothetical protein
MPSKFEQERSQVVLLMRRLGLAPAEYQDPQTGRHARDETGADVVALIEGRRVGIQVTDLDTGDLPGGCGRPKPSSRATPKAGVAPTARGRRIDPIG